MLGEALLFGGFSSHVLQLGATSMGTRLDYPNWSIQSPLAIKPVLEMQVIWLADDYTETNGAAISAGH
ncbi:hypothetical protein KR51_00035320 [Rubidibacter lacunae KORDI 51-2]|uniref:Uncharacterized protein n=1 Tax=Rubidibacter lacunae KORDI 51-2 TaxID=582515 RepID=U5DH93_9CHRO|nr:hypothetical protein [Rubidibacter lacunae]ERN39934.1 hypothetical protein KR51_00035320 [Rubidibacter lacunae KORDI 51-2]